MDYCEEECLLSVGTCVALTVCYVGSLYIWKNSLDRNNPAIIKRRFLSVTIVMLIAPLVLKMSLNECSLKKGTQWELMGLKWEGLKEAILLPLILTMVLFMGPLIMQALSGQWRFCLDSYYWCECFQDLAWWRNHLMAPLSEEWVFRACIIPLMLQCVDPTVAISVGPLFFGLAHYHHVVEQTTSGVPLLTALILSTLQFLFTSMYGWYSSYLFVRTGHIAAPLVTHVFCNFMGFPQFGEVMTYPTVQRSIIIICFILGVVLWFPLLEPITSPEIYSNRFYNAIKV